MVARIFWYIILHVPTYLGVHFFGLRWFRRSNCFIPIRDPNSYKTVQNFFTNFCTNSYKQIHTIIQIIVRIRTQCGFCTNSYIFYTNCIVRIHRTQSMTYVNSYKSDGMNSKKYISLKKMEVAPLAPGITESVDECTKKKRDTISQVTVWNRPHVQFCTKKL